LSDALHERLTERFVDRRTSVLMRRLRENTTLNTEIGKTGEVIVEGHTIGRLDGFTFAPDAAEAGSEAKALQAAAQKALGGEIEARADKLSASADEQFILTSDGTIRWTGDAVAKLVASDDSLRPRIRIIADERLTGGAREKVQARLELWLKTHIEKLLGPLFELQKAEDVTGIARGIAFQLIEALGVIERNRIASELKDLDQPSRATLRKYGVRFGAYHVYFSALLKPAARALASLLWAEKQSNVDLSALSGAQHLASSGRTSFPVDKALPRDAYRVLGYRQCGERAVRVDILERLADLIRPALAWRETSPGEKPNGAFDGRGFVVTQAMTSLTGSAGEDFASILRALGYRMEKRPPLPPKPAAVAAPAVGAAPQATAAGEQPAAEVAADVPAAEAAAELAGDVVTQAAVDDVAPESVSVEPAIEEPRPTASLLPEVSPLSALSEEPPAIVEAAPVVIDAPASEPEPEVAPLAVAQEQAAIPVAPEASQPAPEASAGETVAAPTEAAPAAEPALVEVWRPGGRSEERRPRHERHRHHRPHDRAAAGGEAGATAPAEAGQGQGEKRERHRHGRRDRLKEFGKPRQDGPKEATAEGAVDRAKGEERSRPREHFEGKGREQHRDRPDKQDRKGKFGSERERGPRDHGGRDRDKGGRDRRESGPSHRPYASSAPRERERQIDPNSPFAKLAALKEQLTANRKE
jgi:ATP-dependent RNA helicase SUPV3L1/SUV3